MTDPTPTPRAAHDDEPAEAVVIAEPADGDEESTVEAVGEVVRDMAPWTLSLLVHLAVVVLALFAVWSTMVLAPEEEPLPVSIRPAKHVAPSERLNTTDPTEFTDASADRPIPSEDISDEPVNLPETRPIETLGPGTPTTPSRDRFKTTSDTGKSIFPSPTPGDGLDVGDRPGQPEGTANRVVFVIDASGSLIGELDFVLKQLRETIQLLSDKQQFTVIFFQRDMAIEAAGRGMRPATADNRKRVMDWISPGAGWITPGGSSNPLGALRLAFGYKPDLVYLLSDDITGSGEYELDRDALLAEIDRLNAKAKARIHTIQFLYPDPLDTLDAIARRHGGEHRLIREADLLGR